MLTKTKKEGGRTAYIMASVMLAICILNTTLISPFLSFIITKSSIINSHIISILFYIQIFISMSENFVGYAFIIHKIVKTSVKKALPHMILYQAAVFVSLAFSLVWSYIRSNGLPTDEEFLYSMLSLFLNFVLSAALMYAVAFACYLIKKRTPHSRPETLLPKRNAFLVSAFACAVVEALKQLAIELSYIIPTIINIGSDISLREIISMMISVLFVLFVLAAGYLITVSVIIILEKR